MGAFQPVALSPGIKHLYLAKEVSPARQAPLTLTRKTLPEKSEGDLSPRNAPLRRVFTEQYQ